MSRLFSRLSLFLLPWLLFLAFASASIPFHPKSYNVADPQHDHTTAGKYYERKSDMPSSIASFRAACTYTSEAQNYNDLGRALTSIKRNVPRQTALVEGLGAFEQALWYDRDNNDAWGNIEQIQTQIRRHQWSGEAGRKGFLKHAFDPSNNSPTEVNFPPGLKPILKINSEPQFWNFLSSKLFQLKYFEQWPVLLRGAPRMFGTHYYSIKQMLGGWYKMGNGGYSEPFRNMNFLRGSLAKKSTVSRLPTWFATGTGMRDALRRGYNLQLLHGESWEKSLALFVAKIQNHTKTISSVNVYVTPPQRTLSTPAHTDFTGNLMVQIHGRKRWKLWKKALIWLPANKKYIIGRDEFELLKDEELGKPIMDVVLNPGDVLYVPRGCFHRTATPNMDGTESVASAGDDDAINGVRGEQDLEQKGAQQQRVRDMLTNEEIEAQTSVHLTTHMAKLHDFGGLEQIMTTAMGGNKNALFENRWSDALDQLLTKNIHYRHGLHFRQNWKQKWSVLMHGVVDELLNNTNYLHRMKRNFEESRIRRTRLMFNRHGWHDWDGNEHHLPVIGPSPRQDIDPVFMPDPKQVRKWSVGGTKFHDKCSTPDLPRIQMKYMRRLYNTTATVATDNEGEEESGEGEEEWANEKEIIVVPSIAPVPKGLFMECLYEKEKGMCLRLKEKLEKSKKGNMQEVREVDAKADDEEEKDWEDDEEVGGDNEPSHAIIMLQYKRGKILQQVLGDVSKQTKGSDVYIWNNNVNAKIRCKMMEMARNIAKEAHSTIRTLWIHNSPVNIGPPGSYAMATTIASMYKQFIFIDDDCASPNNMVETFMKEQKQFPKDMISTWGKLMVVGINAWWI